MNKTTFYYTSLIALVVSMACYTIYQGSLVVHHGQEVAGLESTKKELLAQKNSLQQQLAKNMSLTHVQAMTDTQTYQPISKPVSIVASSNVAALP